MCAPSQVEFRSRLARTGSRRVTSSIEEARHLGRPSFGYFSWPRKKSDQPPGCPGLIWLLRSPRLNPRTMLSNLHGKPISENAEPSPAIAVFAFCLFMGQAGGVAACGIAIRLLHYGWTFAISGAGLALLGYWFAVKIAKHRAQVQARTT